MLARPIAEIKRLPQVFDMPYDTERAGMKADGTVYAPVNRL